MKKIIFTLTLMAAFSLALSACSYGGVNFSINSENVQGSGAMKSETRDLSSFSRVELRSIGNLTIQQGEKESITIQADDNLLPYITTDVNGDTLVIGMQPNINVNPSKTIEYTLTVKSLSGVVLSGFGNITAEELNGDAIKMRLTGSGDINVNSVNAKEMSMQLTGFGNITVNEANVDRPTLELTGSGDMKVNQLTAQDLNLTISGFGNATLTGTTDEQTVRLTGSGNYKGGDLQSSSAAITISGFGDATVWAEDALNLNISGSGNVKYYGDPRMTQNISGLGKVNSLGTH
jgi:hypothetical protein